MHKEETLTTNVPLVQANACKLSHTGRGDVAAAAHPDGTYERQAEETEGRASRDTPRTQAKSSEPLTRSKLRSIRLMTKVYVKTRGLLRSGAKLVASSGRVEDSIECSCWLVQQGCSRRGRAPLVRFL